VPLVGLALALFGAPLLLLAFRHFRVNTLSAPMRICLWLLCLAIVLLAKQGSNNWPLLGLKIPTVKTILYAVLATIATLGSWPIVGLLQARWGGATAQTTEQFRRLSLLSFPSKLFVVLTAGSVEEVLYRGYAIGIGTETFGSVWLASTVSLAVFVVAHLRWGLSHLVSVFWAGLILTILFVVSQDLSACILAHVAIDGVGILIIPVVFARRSLN
jgi:membrane protease YdiL (CAAX protease family)